MIPLPTLNIRAKSAAIAEAATVPAQKTCTRIKLFLVPRRAPAMGFPTKSPSPPDAKHMPMRVPTTPKLGERLTAVVGNKDTKVPEKKPYNTQNMIKPALLCIAIQQNARRAEIVAHGIST